MILLANEMPQQCGRQNSTCFPNCDLQPPQEHNVWWTHVGRSLFKTIYIYIWGKVNPLAQSSALISVCMSAGEDGTQLQVLHLSSTKIYESPRQGSAAFSLTDSPFTCPLTPSIFSLWSFPRGSAEPSWQRGTGQLLSVSMTPCLSSAHACVFFTYVSKERKIDRRPLAGPR